MLLSVAISTEQLTLVQLALHCTPTPAVRLSYPKALLVGVFVVRVQRSKTLVVAASRTASTKVLNDAQFEGEPGFICITRVATILRMPSIVIVSVLAPTDGTAVLC